MVCDGSERVDEILRSAMLWDVMGGVARRSWARNPHAMETSEEFNRTHADGYHITMPYVADEEVGAEKNGGEGVSKSDDFIF